MTHPTHFPRGVATSIRWRIPKARSVAFALILAFCLLHHFSGSAAKPKVQDSQIGSNQTLGLARLSEGVSLHNSGSGNRGRSLNDGRELRASYVGPEDLIDALEQNGAQPLSLTSADFDEDGVPDLISGYSYAGRGIVTLLRGNLDSIYPNSPEAQQRRSNGTFTQAPFLSPGHAFEVTHAADFVGAGDFDGDSHLDVVVASRRHASLFVLSGNGKGELSPGKEIKLAGNVTALVTGEINRRDGLTDVVVGVDASDGAKVLVFEGPEGALRSQPELFPTRSSVSSLALGQLDDDYNVDLAVATGAELLLIRGRDRKSSLSIKERAAVPAAQSSKRAFPFSIRSLAIGNFGFGEALDLAALGDDGSIHLLTPEGGETEDRKSSKSRAGLNKALANWHQETLAAVQGQGSTALSRADLSPAAFDDMVLLNPSSGRLDMLTTETGKEISETSKTSPNFLATGALTMSTEPTAVLTMRLDKDGLGDLIVFQKGSSSPSISLSTSSRELVGNRAEHVLFSNPSPIIINGTTFIPGEPPPPAPATPYPSTITVSGQPVADKVRVRLNNLRHEALPQVGVVLVGPAGQSVFLMSGAGRYGDFIELTLTFDDTAALIPRGNDRPLTGTYKPTVYPPVPVFPAPAPSAPYASALSAFNGTDPNGTWSLYVISQGGIGQITGGWTLALGQDSPQPLIVTNTNDSGVGSLRQAILDANANFGADIINFNIGSGAKTIKPLSPLPAITEAVTIDGTTQPGFAGNPIIELTGLEPDFIGPGLEIHASNSVVRGLVINRFIGLPYRGIQVVTGVNNIIEGNFIGTDLSGTVALSRGLTSDATGMIGVELTSSNNLIGGTTAAARNVISGNLWGVILNSCIFEAPVTGNVVQGNFIGTDVTGTLLVENGTGITTGVEGFCGGSPGTTIGGTTAGARNVIAGGSFRIHLVGAESSLVQGNYIGTDVSGTVDLDASNPFNRGDGIDISERAHDVLVGGTTAAARNVISGNWVGVQINGGNTTGCLVQGNYIGTDTSGSSGVNNLFSGVYLLFGTAGNTIGGAVSGARNIISGNNRNGIEIGKLDKAATTNNVIQGNYIGTDVTGTIPLGNGSSGDGIDVPANADGNRIEDNLIAFNARNGVFMPNVDAPNNNPGIRIEIIENLIFANGSLGIDLGNLGVTPNDAQDPDAGPNNLQNFPVLTSATLSPASDSEARIGANGTVPLSTSATVSGTLNSTPNATFTVHWYFSVAPQCANNQPPTQPLVFGRVPGIMTNAAGNAPFSILFDFPEGTEGGVINCTATDAVGNTSEFSACLPVGTTPPPPTPTPSPTFSPPPAPGPTPNNDFFSNAHVINGADGRVQGSNLSAGKEAGEPNHANNRGEKSIWYRWQAPFSGPATFSTYGSSFDTVLGVYTGSTVSGLTEVVSSNDDNEGGALTSRVNFSAVSGTVYQIAVDGIYACGFLGGTCAGESGGVVLTWSLFSSTIIHFDPGMPPSGSSASENSGSVAVRVFRSGDVSVPVTVDYSTSDAASLANCNLFNTGHASSRCDYETTAGTLRFAPGETLKTISIPIIDDSYADGSERFKVSLSNANGAGLSSPILATVIITDNETVNGANPIDQPGFFVRQHYYDFLNREPDAAGLAFWIDQLMSCGSDTQCIEIKRINVSAAYFLSIEFQETGFLVHRFYNLALNRPNGLPSYLEFLRDSQEIGRGVVVGAPGADALLEANKVAYANEFAGRAEFTALYPLTQTPEQYVDALYAHAGITPSAGERQAAISEFANPSGARGRVLRRVGENQTLRNRESNRAFVLAQYFGYLRRNPNDAPDGNFDGYNFWLGKLNQFNGNFINAEMVKAFILSGEYKQRFGP